MHTLLYCTLVFYLRGGHDVILHHVLDTIRHEARHSQQLNAKPQI